MTPGEGKMQTGIIWAPSQDYTQVLLNAASLPPAICNLRWIVWQRTFGSTLPFVVWVLLVVNFELNKYFYFPKGRLLHKAVALKTNFSRWAWKSLIWNSKMICDIFFVCYMCFPWGNICYWLCKSRDSKYIKKSRKKHVCWTFSHAIWFQESLHL